MVSFSQLQAVKKDTIFGGARNFFGPPYSVRALMAVNFQKWKAEKTRKLYVPVFFLLN